MEKAVTQANIKARRIPDGVHKIDTCLYLRVRGIYQSFILKAVIDGKRREVAIGSARDLTLAIAKAKAAKMRGEIAAGTFVLKKERKEERSLPTFAELAEEVTLIQKDRHQWKGENSLRIWRQVVRDYVPDSVKAKPIDQVTKEEVVAMLAAIWNTKTFTASRLRTVAESVFDYANFKGYTDRANPARWSGNLAMIFTDPAKLRQKHHRALTMEQARQLVKALTGSPKPIHRFLLFVLLTAVRMNEARIATWEEMDGTTLVVPKERKKVVEDEDYRLPLSRQALEVLGEPGQGYLFKRKDGEALTHSVVMNHLRKLTGVEDATLHGFRSTFRDWAARSGIDDKVAEKVLSHQWGNKVTRAYLRDDLFEERRAALQAWADALCKES